MSVAPRCSASQTRSLLAACAAAGVQHFVFSSTAAVYGIPERHSYADWRDLVDHEQLDLLRIAAPTTLHAPIAIAALDAGMHVLSEKPMAENADTAIAAAAAACSSAF